MVVIGVVGFKGWKLYGPTNEQVKSMAAHVVEMVQSAIQSRQPAAERGGRSTGGGRRSLTPSQGSAVAAPPMSPSAPLQGEAPKLLVQGARWRMLSIAPPAEAGSPGAVREIG